MSPRHALVSLLLAVAVSGCDRITGVAEQKTKDAEAIGYACRVSATAPADCIANNDTHSPTSLLAGWKAADQDILAKRLDPSMGTNPATAAHLPVAEAAASQVAATKTADAASAPTDTEAETAKDESVPASGKKSAQKH
ncbi:MAG: hypothetical protein COS43_01595 [Gallionellales bacterium CG03_land_8_20_14_0_80_55_15]|nr:MAG: hypothetical protein COS43_01595 [Gallionellales bacterium CG03_land_8_20_14_0_80_55_15]